MHSDGHTPVPSVSSRAKLGEGSTQRVSMFEEVKAGLHQARSHYVLKNMTERAETQ